MSERQQVPYDSIARRWLALVERRQQNLIELCNTGRWRHYYTHAQFLDEMRNVLHLRSQWAWLAGLAVSEQTDIQHIELQPSTKQSVRHKPEFGAQEGNAVVAQRAWAAAAARVGDFGSGSGTSLTGWT
jgi:uncharacterized repeat protein (TIGR03809 family)